MSSDPPDPSTASVGAADRSVTLAEVLALAAGLALALVTLAALGTALLEAHTVATVAACTGAGLLLAAALVALHPIRVALAPRDLLFAVLLAGLAAALTVPGWDYVSGDRDPGVYVTHAVAISRDGSVTIPDQIAAAAARIPVVPTDPAPVRGPHGRFPGLWPAPDDPAAMKPQFYDAYASLLAVGFGLGGRPGLTAVGPICAALSVVALGLATRRAFGATAGALAAVLLATNGLQVWQARYPTAEVPTQALATVALLALVVAVQLRWRPAAGLAGVLTGAIFVVRPDGVLLVLGAVLAVAGAFALRRFDARWWWFTIGIGAVMPLALWEAYGLNGEYTVANQAPGAGRLATLVAAGALAGVVGRVAADLARPRLAGRVDLARWSRGLGIAGSVGFAAFVVLCAARPWLTPDVTAVTSRGTVVPTFEEDTVARLSWFLSWPGIVLMVAGLAVVAVRPWRADRLVLVIPPVALVPVFLWNPHISSRLMWWGRRFVPLALVGIVLLVGLAIAAALRWRGRGHRGWNAAGVLAAIWMVGFSLHTSLPLTRHDELDGVWELVDELSALADGRQGLYLWTAPDGTVYAPARVLGGPLWLVGDQLSAVLPEEPTAEDLDAFLAEFPDAPVFVVTDGEPPPAAVLDAGAEPVLGGQWTVPLWEESDTDRPTKAVPLQLDLAVWQLR